RRRSVGAAGNRSRAPHTPVARLTVHGALPGRTRRARQYFSTARCGCARPGRALPARGIRHGRLHRVRRPRSAVGPRAGIRSLFGMTGLAGSAPGTSGRSLASALSGFDSAAGAHSLTAGGRRVNDRTSFGESLVPLLHYGWSDLHAVRDGRWKYILAPKPELYD